MHRVHVAERLRRQTANLIPSGCAGSNPVVHVVSESVCPYLCPFLNFLLRASFSSSFSRLSPLLSPLGWRSLRTCPGLRVGFAKEHVLGEPS